jgi:protein-disulfide isomerase
MILACVIVAGLYEEEDFGMQRKRGALQLVLFSLLGTPYATAQEKVETSRPEIEKIVREYILQHPEVIAQAANLYQEQQKAAAKTRAKEAVTVKLSDLQQDPSSPVTGAAGGLTIVEFFDYHCGYCRRAEPTIEKLLVDHPDIKFVFKEFPILGAESTLAAKASLAANKQGGYLKFHQVLMTLPGSITMGAIEQLAAKQGLDVAKLKTDMESPEVKAILDRNGELASQVGVKATPSFVIRFGVCARGDRRRDVRANDCAS